MKRPLIVLSLTAMLVAGAGMLATPAGASPSQAVHIVVQTSLVQDQPPDPFTAIGQVCPSGGVVNDFDSGLVGGRSGSHAQILIGKVFACAGHPGDTFELLLRVTLNFQDGSTTGTWNVLRGTGAFAKLHGTGILQGTPDPTAPRIVDVYDGTTHID
jgi:hypothetical protein